MLDVTALLEEIKASPYEEIDITAPHTGVIEFAKINPGDKVQGPSGSFREKSGTAIAFIERERNKKTICTPQKGEIALVHRECADRFVEAGTPLARIRHYLSKDEVLERILKKTLHLFPAPERAKYYFTPEIDLKIKASGAKSVHLTPGKEICIMNRMKREAPVVYDGPEGVIYAVYFKHNENVDAGAPLLGVCKPSELPLIEDVVIRVQTEWEERD